jgi:hypothetical protein
MMDARLPRPLNHKRDSPPSTSNNDVDAAQGFLRLTTSRNRWCGHPGMPDASLQALVTLPHDDNLVPGFVPAPFSVTMDQARREKNQKSEYIMRYFNEHQCSEVGALRPESI